MVFLGNKKVKRGNGILYQRNEIVMHGDGIIF